MRSQAFTLALLGVFQAATAQEIGSILESPFSIYLSEERPSLALEDLDEASEQMYYDKKTGTIYELVGDDDDD